MPSYGDIGPPSQSIPPRSIPPSADGIVLGSGHSVAPSAPPESVDPSRQIAPFLQKLAQTTDPDKFAAVVSGLEPKIRNLFETGQVATAWRLCSTLEVIAGDAPGLLSRAEHAKRALEVFRDPAILAPLAERALDGVVDRDGTAARVVVRAGKRGAHALYQARLKHAVFEARERFVALMQSIGAAALPIFTTALERLETRLNVSGAAWVAEDLLRAIPEVPDEALGAIVARYMKSPAASIALHATNAIARVWKERSRPLLRNQLHHKEDDVVVAALKRLRALGGVDRELLEQLRPIVSGALATRPPVRLAVTEALVDVTPEARATAAALLGDALRTTVGTTPDVEDAVVMISSTLLAIGGDGALVAARWKQSTMWLRTRLEAVLRKSGANARA